MATVKPRLNNYLFFESQQPSALENKASTHNWKMVERIQKWMGDHQRLIFCVALAATAPFSLGSIPLGGALIFSAGVTLINLKSRQFYSKDVTWIALAAGVVGVATHLPLLMVTLPILVDFVTQQIVHYRQERHTYRADFPRLLDKIVEHSEKDTLRSEIVVEFKRIQESKESSEIKTEACIQVLCQLTQSSEEYRFAAWALKLLKRHPQWLGECVIWNDIRVPKDLISAYSSTLKNCLETSEQGDNELENLLGDKYSSLPTKIKNTFFHLILDPTYGIRRLRTLEVMELLKLFQSFHCEHACHELTLELCHRMDQPYCSNETFIAIVNFARQHDILPILADLFDVALINLERETLKPFRKEMEKHLGLIAFAAKECTHPFSTQLEYSDIQHQLILTVGSANFKKNPEHFSYLKKLLSNRTYSSILPLKVIIHSSTLSQAQVGELLLMNHLTLDLMWCTFIVPESTVAVKKLQIATIAKISKFQKLYEDCRSNSIPISLQAANAAICTSEMKLSIDKDDNEYQSFVTPDFSVQTLDVDIQNAFASFISKRPQNFSAVKVVRLSKLHPDEFLHFLDFVRRNPNLHIRIADRVLTEDKLTELRTILQPTQSLTFFDIHTGH